jgi:RNA polymerase sigma-70 factor (ECF subfamily)
MTEPAPPVDPDTGLTELLQAAQQGDAGSQEAAARLVYGTLHTLAAGYLRAERGDHTLQPTALVHEAYLRLLGQDAPWKSRAHFFGIAAQMMRRILVDHARRSTAGRRDRTRSVSLSDLPDADERLAADVPPSDAVQDVLGVHEALEQLETLDPRQAKVVELKFFVGLTIEEIADVLGVSHATVSREWAMARVWLQQRIESQ